MLGMKPCVGSEMYTAKTTSIVVEDTLRLIAERQPEAMHIHMDRNTTDASEATSEWWIAFCGCACANLPCAVSAQVL